MERIGTDTLHSSLSKDYPNAPVSAIIEEMGDVLWKTGEKTHGMSQSLWIWRHWCRKTIFCGR
ncbi:MAG: hypothetical protein UDN35_02730, partial [Oscillospiraceae bacterium]|nr:hypothetical protein [Oscillospiraceae bacterium]